MKGHFFDGTIVALSIAMAAGSATAATETIRSKILKANVDAFLSGCNADGVAAADCWCMVKALNSTRDGAFILDMMGLRIRKLERNKAEVLAAVNRHGLKRSEVVAILPRGPEIINKADKDCE